MKKELIPIGLLSFVNILGFAVLIPVLPFIVDLFGGNAIVYGFVLAIYPACQFIGAPILGKLSDKHGRRPTLLISQAGTLMSWFIFAAAFMVPEIYIGPFALGLYVLAFSRMVDGITGGNFSVSNAYISDITKPSEKTKVYGIIGSIFGFGLIVGPVLGGWLSGLPMGYGAVVGFSVLLSTITFISMYYFLPETLTKENMRKDIHIHLLTELNIFQRVQSFDALIIRKLFFIRGFFALTFSSYTAIIVLFIKDTFGFAPEQIGSMFLVLGSFFIINQALVTPWLARKVGTLKAMYIGQALLMTGLVLLVPANTLWIFFPVAFLINVGFSSNLPTFKTLITDLVPRNRQGEITGVDESVLAGASALAPIIAGISYQTIGIYSFMFFACFLTIPHIVIKIRSGKWLLSV